ncbi:MAG: pectinacetylesterase family protein [Lachnospiraceae bacterium]|nr:pectinacetylesterase family protein [Lachnospiraceae bacterium]
MLPVPDKEKHTEVSIKVGEILESFADRTMKKHEAPLLMGYPEAKVWYSVPLPEGISGDGSEYHFYIKKGTEPNLCIFLSGGGVAWNGYTAARPVSGGKVAAKLPNFYWNNLRPFSQLMNIHTGITQILEPANPVKEWNMAVITYSTGDFHVGNSEFRYKDEAGRRQVLHFHGYHNFLSAMRTIKIIFPSAEKLLIAGDSAGGFAVPALAPEIIRDHYPGCGDITLFSDSAQLLFSGWRDTARNVWKSPEHIWKPILSDNITVDWYRNVYSQFGDDIRYLYAGSPRDFLLSEYYNDILNDSFSTNPRIRNRYCREMKRMLFELKGITDKFGIMVYNFKNYRQNLGGTVHTAVRHPRFYSKHTGTGISMSEWLGDAINGNVYDAGGKHFEY